MTVTGIYNIVWPHMMGNCHLTRPTGDYILGAGKWSETDVKTIDQEDPWLVIPHFSGRLVKA